MKNIILGSKTEIIEIESISFDTVYLNRDKNQVSKSFYNRRFGFNLCEYNYEP